MKSLGDIYRDSFEKGKNKWYHVIFMYAALVSVGLALAPAVLWRTFTGTKSKTEIEAKKYSAK